MLTRDSDSMAGALDRLQPSGNNRSFRDESCMGMSLCVKRVRRLHSERAVIHATDVVMTACAVCLNVIWMPVS